MKLIFDLIVKAREQMMKNYKIPFKSISKSKLVIYEQSIKFDTRTIRGFVFIVIRFID